jgi:hypothetical protein
MGERRPEQPFEIKRMEKTGSATVYPIVSASH